MRSLALVLAPELDRPTFELAPAGFTPRRAERCPDCDLRGALKADGSVVVLDGHRLSTGCETCQDRGDLDAFGRAVPRGVRFRERKVQRDLYTEAA